jgi:hypothetical protein
MELNKLQGFEALASILLICPDGSPLPTVDIDSDKDIVIEWYFGEGLFVELNVGENFPKGKIYTSLGSVTGVSEVYDYSPEKLLELIHLGMVWYGSGKKKEKLPER